MSKVALSTDTEIFLSKLKKYKKLIDEDIAAYSRHIEQTTLQQYGANSRVATDAFLSILNRGGKRIRGALVMLGYEMSGGKDRGMIAQAARATEIIHAYMLIIDDIQDRSAVRRGGPTAHVMLADYHRKNHLADDSDHFGEAIAINAALGGGHAAQMILANLDAPEDLRIKVLSIMNRTMSVTIHGQTSDIMNEVSGKVGQKDVEQVMEWKTANYTVLNPLHVGMVLAEADCHATDAITDYALNIGKAFQVSDDILGTFGTEFESGKNPLDDIKEGKRTLLSVYALEHANNADKNFLIQMLGNEKLTQAEFHRCKEVFMQSGALAYAQAQAEQYVSVALQSLDKEAKRWKLDGIQFLRGLAQYLLTRQS